MVWEYLKTDECDIYSSYTQTLKCVQYMVAQLDKIKFNVTIYLTWHCYHEFHKTKRVVKVTTYFLC